MITIIRNRDSGKAKQLMEIARKNNCAIITQDKAAFEVKAHSYGYDDIQIYDYNDLKDDTYSFGEHVLIHNGDKMLAWLLDYFYGIEVDGMSATCDENKG